MQGAGRSSGAFQGSVSCSRVLRCAARGAVDSNQQPSDYWTTAPSRNIIYKPCDSFPFRSHRRPYLTFLSAISYVTHFSRSTQFTEIVWQSGVQNYSLMHSRSMSYSTVAVLALANCTKCIQNSLVSTLLLAWINSTSLSKHTATLKSFFSHQCTLNYRRTCYSLSLTPIKTYLMSPSVYSSYTPPSFVFGVRFGYMF